ncbi:MAG: acyltransferase [Roseburia sp.]|jgi:hypothetical protein|nr:acyltransferase [Roseburia sp.]
MTDKTGKTGKTQRAARNSSFELLRILALVLIFWMHGSSSYSNNELSAWLCIAISTVGNIGVSLFILISGWFGIRLNVKKMIKLDLMLMFYCWIGLALQYVWGTAGLLDGSQKLAYILPVIGRFSWYFTCYFALAFLSPFLNEMTEKLTRERFFALIVTMLVIFSGITTCFFFDITQDGGKGIVNMILLYLIGRYLRMYHEDHIFSTGKLLAVFAGTSIVNFALNGGLYVVTGTVQNRFARDNTLFTIAEAVCIFLVFRNFHFENRLVNKIAGMVPAVFIMEWTLRTVITTYLFDYLAWRESSWHELILLGTSLLLVVIGSMIEAVRRLLLGRAEEKIAETECRMMDRIRQKVRTRVKKG